MGEKELNSYRFGSGKEPTDEMLAAIMNAACADAAERAKKAADKYRMDYEKQYRELYLKWHNRIDDVRNGIY